MVRYGLSPDQVDRLPRSTLPGPYWVPVIGPHMDLDANGQPSNSLPATW